MPWNTSSFTVFDYNMWNGYKTTYITKVDRSHNIQWWVFKIWKLCKVKQNTILCNLGYRCEPKVFIKIQRNQYNLGHVNRCVEVEHRKDSTDCQSIGETNNWRKGVDQWWKWILRYHRQKFRSSSSGSIDEKPYCDEEGNRSSNRSQEWLGTGWSVGVFTFRESKNSKEDSRRVLFRPI